jgi:tetratricopeptide (TPR) repeat protein
MMKQHQRGVIGKLGTWRCTSALLFAGLLPIAWAGPKEDGDAAFKAGKMAEAEAAYTQALTANPDDASALIERGRARYNLGRKTDAAADFDHAVQVAPNNPDAWHYRGIFRYAERDYKAALDDLNKNVELAPQSALAFEGRGAVQVELRNYTAAIVDCTRAIQIRPDYVLALNWRGFAWEQSKDPDSALRDFEAVIKLDPRNTYALTHRAIIYEARGDKGKAAQEYRIVLALDPKQKDAASHLAALQNASAAAPASVQTVAPKTQTARSTAAPATPATSASALTSPAVKPRSGFQLAASVEYTFDRRSVSACAPDIEWTGDWQTPGGQCGVRWRWTVPPVLVPETPAKIHLEGSVTGTAWESACVALETMDANGEAWSHVVAAARVSNIPNYKYPTNATDDCDLLLPDPARALPGPKAPGQGHGAKSVVRLRNDQEMRHIAGDYDQGISADSAKTPGQVPVEDCPIDLGAGKVSAKELVLSVYAEGDLNRPLAQYTYRWTADVGQRSIP